MSGRVHLQRLVSAEVGSVHLQRLVSGEVDFKGVGSHKIRQSRAVPRDLNIFCISKKLTDGNILGESMQINFKTQHQSFPNGLP